MKRLGLYLGVLFLSAAAAALYTTRLGFAPIYLTHDEVNFSLQAASVADTGRDLNGRLLPVYFSEPAFTAGRDPMMIYATALVLQVLPLSESAVRLPTALVGIVNILLVVWLAQLLFRDARLSLAAGVMLALSPGHFIHSRLALSVLYPVPFVIAWLIAMRRVGDPASQRMLFVGGVFLGLGIYGYLASMVMMPVYLLLTALVLAERRQLKLIGWAAAGFAVVLVPVVLWTIAHPERFDDLMRAYRPGDVTGESTLTDAARVMSAGSWRSKLSEWWLYFDPAYLFLSGDSSLTNSTRQAGLFPLAMAVFLPIGVWRLSRTRGFERLLLVGLITAPLAVVLTGVLHLHRYRGMFVLPFGVVVATYGLSVMWASPRRVWRLAATALLLTIPIQFAGFYRDYMGSYRERTSEWYGGNLRAALLEVMRHPPVSGATYVSRGIPYADVYWRFYAQTTLGAPASPELLDPEIAETRSFAAGAKAITAVDEPLAAVLDRTGWRRETVVTEPGGRPAFVVFQKL
ncbi:MAG: glycosyltransferase family 39 protein [Acidobacteriota bacterium]|nr:glycosyltransferase family 39 protein [Acidobacteriota bacterium]